MTVETLVSLADVEAAHERVRDSVRRTPLVSAPWPSADGAPQSDSPDSIWLRSPGVRRVPTAPICSFCCAVDTFSTVSSGQKWKCRPGSLTCSFGLPNNSS